MVSKFQWKPFWLATQRDPQNDWTATQNRVNYDVFAQAHQNCTHGSTINGFKIAHININHLLHQKNFINELISKNNISIFAVNETWLSEDISDGEISNTTLPCVPPWQNWSTWWRCLYLYPRNHQLKNPGTTARSFAWNALVKGKPWSTRHQCWMFLSGVLQMLKFNSGQPWMAPCKPCRARISY